MVKERRCHGSMEQTQPDTASLGSVNTLLIAKDISYIQKDITSIKSSIEALRGVYVTKLEYDDSEKNSDKRITALEGSSSLWKWLSPTLAAIIAVVVEYLFLFYIQHIK